jgi:hypothetical protein
VIANNIIWFIAYENKELIILEIDLLNIRIMWNYDKKLRFINIYNNNNNLFPIKIKNYN